MKKKHVEYLREKCLVHVDREGQIVYQSIISKQMPDISIDLMLSYVDDNIVIDEEGVEIIDWNGVYADLSP